MPASVFEEYTKKAWPFSFKGQVHVDRIAGGVPTNPKVAEGWIRSKLSTTDDLIREMVADAMVSRGVDPQTGELDREAVIEQVASLKSLNGFKRDDTGLYIEGRQLKAALKEAVSVSVASGKLRQRDWGETRKWITKFFPEHVFILEDRMHLRDAQGVPFREHTGINQRFVTNMRGQRAIQYEEYCEGAYVDFTLVTDYDFDPDEWAMIWLTGERQGIGAARSAGFGTYTVTKWEPASKKPAKKTARKR